MLKKKNFAQVNGAILHKHRENNTPSKHHVFLNPLTGCSSTTIIYTYKHVVFARLDTNMNSQGQCMHTGHTH